ncbi:MAG: TolC family protein [Muribaculaceae bacterium]|nr:TolC family protein [Muribaculaceae bacterium]
MYYRIITTIALVLATLGANAQATDEPVLLSLDECVRIALSDNPTIHINEMEIQRVKYSKKEIQGQLLPNINFTGQYNRTLAKQTMTMNAGDEPMTIKVGMDNQHSVGFNASMPLIMPTLWKTLKLNDNQILQNIENARANKLSLVNQVKNAYYALLLAQDSKNVIEENHATAQLNASIYQKQFELGTASEYDVLRANVAVTNLEPSILEAENYIDLLKLQLKVLMGMDVRTPIAPRQTLDEFKARMYDQSILADTSLVSNTSLRSLELKTDYLKRALDTQKMSWYPTLTASANYMWNSMSNGSPFKNFNWNPYSTVGLTLTLPLFQGGQRYYKQRQAEVALREMTWQRENLERSLKMQVQNQVDIINKTLKQISSNEGGVRQATKANDIVQQSFKIGAASFIQLRDTEDALMNARLSYYQAIYNYLVAECDLEYLLGNTHYVAK